MQINPATNKCVVHDIATEQNGRCIECNPYRPTPARLIVGPVKHFCQMIHDAEGNHVCDVRGYGRLSYMENGDELQDKIGDWLADAINEKLTKNPI